MPNVLSPLIVLGTLGIGTVIIDAAALSFLGFGAQPPTPEWGAMLGQEFNQLFSAPHLVIFPGIAIMITVLAFNLLGDGLRDVLDPATAFLILIHASNSSRQKSVAAKTARRSSTASTRETRAHFRPSYRCRTPQTDLSL